MPTEDPLSERLRMTEQKLEAITQIGQILASEQRLDTVLDEIIKRTTVLMGCERATLFLVSSDESNIWAKVSAGSDLAPKTIELRLGEGIAGWVAAQARSVNVKDAYKDPRFSPKVDAATGFRTRSILCQPLRDSRQRVLGVVQALNKIDGYFTTADESLLLAIASQAAVCVQNSRLYVDLVSRNIDLFDTQLRLQERTAEMELLFRIERTAAVAMTLTEALDGALGHTLAEYPADLALVALRDPRTGDIAVERAHGPRAAGLEGKEIAHETIARVMAGGGAVTLDSAELAGSCLCEHVALQYLAVLPIARADEEPLGVLVLANPHHHPPTLGQHDVHKLSVIASRMALSVVLARVMEEERKAERLAAVGGALSGVVHDLRTPLTVIGGYARMLEKEPDAEKRRAHREVVKRQIEVVQQMIQELLAFVRGESQVLARKVWVREFMSQVEEMLAAELEGSPIALHIEVGYKGGVKMDEGKMRRVVANLAKNAREAMTSDGRAGGTFTVRVTEAGGVVSFAFSDTGPGIPKALERRLFESFATHGKKAGTGLGLAIVKKIVDEHGGTLTVDSVPGVGTTFNIGLAASG